MKEKSTDVGVIVGRLQCHKLTDAHKDVIQYVCDQHHKVVIFLGLSPCKCTVNNPLDFEARKQMLSVSFPEVTILYIKDCASDQVWSKNLDAQIRDVIGPTTKATLYGSRDSFLINYVGSFPTKELIHDKFVSASELRRQISAKVKATEDFRAGVIWAINNQFPKVYPCVDICVFNQEKTKILVARKPQENKWRFIGGFVDPQDISFEAAARREVKEEAGIEIGDLEYVGSASINDWRYKNEVDKVKTLFFESVYVFGAPKADDDIAELFWLDLIEKGLNSADFVEEHKILVEQLRLKYPTFCLVC